MVVSVHQANFFPWLGYFHKIAQSDVFVLLDEVQFIKGSYCNRAKIKNNLGKEVWLTVPVNYKDGQSFTSVTIDEQQQWPHKGINLLKASYDKAPYFSTYGEEVIALFQRSYASIFELNYQAILWMMKVLGITTKVVLQSSIQAPLGTKSQLNLDICKALGANVYLSGTGAKKYNDEASFEESKITLSYQSFTHPEYKQLHGAFFPGLSILDVLFNEGPDNIKNYLEL